MHVKLFIIQRIFEYTHQYTPNITQTLLFVFRVYNKISMLRVKIHPQSLGYAAPGS